MLGDHLEAQLSWHTSGTQAFPSRRFTRSLSSISRHTLVRVAPALHGAVGARPALRCGADLVFALRYVDFSKRSLHRETRLWVGLPAIAEDIEENPQHNACLPVSRFSRVDDDLASRRVARFGEGEAACDECFALFAREGSREEMFKPARFAQNGRAC